MKTRVSKKKHSCDLSPHQAVEMSETRPHFGATHLYERHNDTADPATGDSQMAFKTDIQIAREANKKPIQEIGEKLGISSDDLLGSMFGLGY